ncbi:NADPH-dependent FMN reductase [Agriterribacter sp.]|uniref:NADPH-dependent FMN reductase n=1 Tax=Agriterribacter sp. TaxID=2821509 RepID=UPI002BFA16C1|nr:NADPH-dependent FMN reductase [Agriterribacter sp.]HTN06043.1 NADPH-dependent FMN reductase [Agriterribacter sp.]
MCCILIRACPDSYLTLPQFNPDDDTENPPVQVTDLRKQIKEANGILICIPEYAMGVPGSLKNLLDWTVSSSDFSNKPVVAITASSLGQKAHLSLLGTLQVIEARIDESTQLLISFIKTKVNDRQQITDENTLKDVRRIMDSFIAVLNN